MDILVLKSPEEEKGSSKLAVLPKREAFTQENFLN